MHEQLLREFFEARASAAQLASDLVGSLEDQGSGVTRHPIVDMAKDFRVASAHLVRACDAVLAGAIDPANLRAIGFCLLASDHFQWDGDTSDGALVAEVAHDWSCPEVNYPLTVDNVRQWRNLLTGQSYQLARWPTGAKPQLPTADHKKALER